MKRILFVGNSFTYYCDMPGMLARLSAEAGYELSVASVTKGGWWLERYADPENEMYAPLHETYQTQQWDHIILQEQSFNPANDPERYLAAVRKLTKQLACKQFIIYQTWAWEDGSEKLATTGMTYQQMQEGLRDGCRRAAQELNALLVPVGDAWRTCYETHPEIKLYKDDHFHPCVTGAYLTSCVFFGALTGQSPLFLNTVEDVPEQTAAILRQIAADTLQK